MPELGSRFPVLGSPNPSYPALCRQATSYAWRNRLRRIPLGRSDCCHWRVPASRAGLRCGPGWPEYRRDGVDRDSWLGLAAQVARGPPQRRDGGERRGAPYATHSVFWRTGAQKDMENVTYFEHQQKDEILVPDRSAKYITHSDVS